MVFEWTRQPTATRNEQYFAMSGFMSFRAKFRQGSENFKTVNCC